MVSQEERRYFGWFIGRSGSDEFPVQAAGNVQVAVTILSGKYVKYDILPGRVIVTWHASPFRFVRYLLTITVNPNS